MVMEDSKKNAKAGGAFQVMGLMDMAKIPKDLSSVSGGHYAGCTSSETDAPCGNAFKG